MGPGYQSAQSPSRRPCGDDIRKFPQAAFRPWRQDVGRPGEADTDAERTPPLPISASLSCFKDAGTQKTFKDVACKVHVRNKQPRAPVAVDAAVALETQRLQCGRELTIAKTAAGQVPHPQTPRPPAGPLADTLLPPGLTAHPYPSCSPWDHQRSQVGH